MMRCRPALGTFVEIQADGAHASVDLAQAIDAAYAAIATVQSCMSVFETTSDVARINAGHFLNAPGPVHPWLWDVLHLAQRIHLLCPSFDPCACRPLIAQGLRPIGHGAPTGSLQNIELRGDGQLVTTASVYLDLGGIAKGYAVDRAVDALQAHGASSGCVNAGGDLRVFGTQARPIYLRDPQAPQRTVLAGTLQDGALATSGDYFATATSARGHLIDPARATFVAAQGSYSVMASRCAVADALTKVFAITQDAQHPAFHHFGAHALQGPI